MDRWTHSGNRGRQRLVLTVGKGGRVNVFTVGGSGGPKVCSVPLVCAKPDPVEGVPDSFLLSPVWDTETHGSP